MRCEHSSLEWPSLEDCRIWRRWGSGWGVRVWGLGRSAFDLPTLLLPLSYDCKHCVNKVKRGRIMSLLKQILSSFLSYSSIYIVFVIHTELAWFLFRGKWDGQETRLTVHLSVNAVIITKSWWGIKLEKGETKVSPLCVVSLALELMIRSINRLKLGHASLIKNFHFLLLLRRYFSSCILCVIAEG